MIVYKILNVLGQTHILHQVVIINHVIKLLINQIVIQTQDAHGQQQQSHANHLLNVLNCLVQMLENVLVIPFSVEQYQQHT